MCQPKTAHLPCPVHAGGTQNPAKVVGYVLLYTLLMEASLNPNRAPGCHAKKWLCV